METKYQITKENLKNGEIIYRFWRNGFSHEEHKTLEGAEKEHQLMLIEQEQDEVRKSINSEVIKEWINDK